MAVFKIELPKFKQNSGVAGIGAQAVAQNLLRLVHFVHPHAQPVGRDEIGLNAMLRPVPPKFSATA